MWKGVCPKVNIKCNGFEPILARVKGCSATNCNGMREWQFYRRCAELGFFMVVLRKPLSLLWNTENRRTTQNEKSTLPKAFTEVPRKTNIFVARMFLSSWENTYLFLCWELLFFLLEDCANYHSKYRPYYTTFVCDLTLILHFWRLRLA